MDSNYFDKADEALRNAAIDAAVKAKKFGHGLIVTDDEGNVQELDPEVLLSSESQKVGLDTPRQIAK